MTSWFYLINLCKDIMYIYKYNNKELIRPSLSFIKYYGILKYMILDHQNLINKYD